MDAKRDRDLLFGMLAVQLRGVTPAQLAEVSAAWTADPAVTLAQRMVDTGLLSGGDRALLETLVEDAVRTHDGDTAAVMALMGGREHVEKTCFAGQDGNLDDIDTSPMEGTAFSADGGPEVSGVHEAPGRYTLVSHHAKGGMGRVLIVHDEYLGRNIALKELLPPGSPQNGEEKPSPIRQSAALVARFLQEARITSQLEHPAIVPVYELGRRQDGSVYYTMRLVRGRTFADALKNCKTLDLRLRLLSNFTSLCQAMAYAHSRGVIHRDIKPANVMLGAFGETVVLDWGLAKVRDTEDIHVEDIRDSLDLLDVDGDHAAPKTAYGKALGTPHYMPPEQAGGRIEAIDERSDVYSLGAVLYEILTGCTPYSGKNTREILEKVITARPIPVPEAEPDAPPELAVICAKAMEKDPARRYQSATELAEEVQRFIDGSLVRAYRYTLRQMMSHYYARHRTAVNTALAFAVVLLVVGVCSYVSILQARNREAAQRAVAETQAYQSQIHLAQAYINTHETARASEVLWKTAPAGRGWEWRYLLNQANPDAYTVELPEADLFSAVFSPDGTRIGTNTYPRTPAIYEAATGRKLADMEGEPIRCDKTAFSPDGALYIACGGGNVIQVWDAATGRRRLRLTQQAVNQGAVFNAAGTLLFAGYNDGKVRAHDLATGNVAFEMDAAASPVNAAAMSPTKERLLTMAGTDTLQLWDLAGRTPLFSITGLWPVFSPDGTRIATVQNADAVLWDAETGAELRRFRKHVSAVYDLRFNTAGNRLLSASGDGSVCLWDTATGELLRQYVLPDARPAMQAFFLGDESAVLAYSGDNTGLVFPGASVYPAYQFQGRGRMGEMAALQPNGPLFLMVPNGQHLFQTVNPLAPTGVESVVASPNSDTVSHSALSSSATGTLLALSLDGDNGGISLVDTDAKRCLCRFAAAFGNFTKYSALSADGARLVLTADSHVPVAVNDPAGTPVWTAFTGHDARITALAMRPDGRQAASGDLSGTVFLWNTGTANMEKALPAQSAAVRCLNFSGDGNRLLSATQDGTVTLWAVGTGTATLTLAKQAQPMVTAAFNAGADRILTLTTGGAVQQWDADTGTLLATTPAGQGRDGARFEEDAMEAQFLPGDRLSLVRLPFECGRLWDTATNTPLVSFPDGELVHPMNNNRTLAIVDGWGDARTEDVPDIGAVSTPDAYARYRREWAARTALAAQTDAPEIFLFISREDLARALADMAGLATEAFGTDMSFAVTESGRTPDMTAMGLRSGDRITALNNAPFTSADGAGAALENTGKQIAGEAQGSLPVTLSRNGQTMKRIYWTLPLTRGEAATALTRGEALELLLAQQTALADNAPADAAWVNVPPPPNRGVSDKLQSTTLVKLISIDGRLFQNMNTAGLSLEQLRQRIASGETTHFTETFRTGVYREHTRTFTVSPG